MGVRACSTFAIVGLCTFAFSVASVRPTLARPEHLVRFQADPMRKAAVDGCGACHVKPEGGGARNDFGTAFDAAAREITPLLRASFPSHFDFTSATLPDGSTFHFSDPQSRVAVFERGEEKSVVDLAAITAPKVAALPPAANRMSFFVASESAGHGGHLGGLAGADRHCQALAKAAGAADRTWRAYLSTGYMSAAAANAGDRIGTGPWYNARGVLVARGPVDLHAKGTLGPAVFLTEKGDPVGPAVTVFTGTLANGTAAPDQTCGNWTSTAGEALVGAPGEAWNSARPASCAAGTGAEATAPRLYCFALR